MSTLPFPFPQSEFIPWQPPGDGARFTVPAPANSLTSYPTLRVQNLTRGTLYITNNVNSLPSESSYDYRIGPYSSETITPYAQGVEVAWYGVAGSGENVGFTWSSERSAPGGSSVGEPYFPQTETASWFPADVGDDTYLGQFLSPVGSLAVWQIFPPVGNQGQTIVALQIENRTNWHLFVQLTDSAGPIIGIVEPMKATTLQVGANQVYISTDGPNINRGGGDQFVNFYAYNSIPKFDPAAMYDLPGVHEPAGSMLQVSAHDVFSTAGGTLYTIPLRKVLVIHQLWLELQQQAAGAGTVNTFEIYATRGFDGAGVAQRLLANGVLGTGTSDVTRGGPVKLDGPLYVPSNGLVANAIAVRRIGGAHANMTVNAGVWGWQLPDTQ